MRAFLVACCLAAIASPALAQDYRLQTSAAAELQQICTADAGQLWRTSLCGPLIVVEPSTRQVWATQRDNTNVLALTAGGGWVGILPVGVPVANSAVEWGGVRWIMVVGPLPEDSAQRRTLVTHEAWHRIQDSIGLAMRTANAPHLETERGRYLLRLELRALATAMLSNGRAQLDATKDAVAFRMARFASFPDAAGAESSLDRNEGLAAYTGVRLGAGAQARLFAARTLSDFDNHQAFARTYAYASGPAYGLLLDEYVPNWRSSLAAWAPADLLVSPLRIRPYDASDLQRRADRYGGPQIASEEQARAETQRQRIAALRARFGGPRLELTLQQVQLEYDPNQITPVQGLGDFYQVITLRDVWGEFRATEGALLSPDFTRLTAAQPVQGGLSGPGWRLTLASGYRMSTPDTAGVVRPELIPSPPVQLPNQDN